MVPHVHGKVADFFTNPIFGRRRQAVLPRSWFKTWLVTIGGSIWMTLPDEEELYKDIFPFKGANARILIGSNVSDNSEKMIEKIRREWMENERLKCAFPELVPDYAKVRWSNSCAQLNRNLRATEGSYTSVGVGGGVISQHFDLIIEDDLIYAKKDDFTGQELLPDQEAIDKAIGWHKLVDSLFVHPKQSCIWNVGTRWSPHDLVDFIRRNESRSYHFFEITVTDKNSKDEARWPIEDNQHCLWPERFDCEALHSIRDAQGAKIFETQYLCRPRAGEDITFDIKFLNCHESLSEFPQDMKYYTIVDLATWTDKKRIANNVIMTGAKDERNHLWIARIDAGKFTPTDVILYIKEHQKQFNSKVLVEEIQYQSAIRHFAKVGMEVDGHFYNIEAIPNENKKNAKDLRIEGLEPLVRNSGMHVLSYMHEFIQEMEDYPYAHTRDRLDCAGYLWKYGTPATTNTKNILSGVFFNVTRESIEEECKKKAVEVKATEYPFEIQVNNGEFATFN